MTAFDYYGMRLNANKAAAKWNTNDDIIAYRKRYSLHYPLDNGTPEPVHVLSSRLFGEGRAVPDEAMEAALISVLIINGIPVWPGDGSTVIAQLIINLRKKIP